LLTTIPKCGKNVLVSFLSGLGLDRQSGGPDLFEAATHAQARWYLGQLPGNPEQHDSQGLLAQTAPAFDRVLDALARMPDNAYVHGHFVFDPELHRRVRDAGISVVFLYRDPRASLASLAHFLLDRGEPASLARRLPGRDLGTVLRFLIDGDDESPPYEHFFTPYQGWKDAEGVTVVRFEDIIGPRGGGSAGLQFAILSALASRIGWRGDPERLTTAISQTFNPGAGTFRRGTIDGWSDDLRELRGTTYWQRIRALAREWEYVDAQEPLPAIGNRHAAPVSPPRPILVRPSSTEEARASHRAAPARTEPRPAISQYLFALRSLLGLTPAQRPEPASAAARSVD
jgi:hypothetical protein